MQDSGGLGTPFERDDQTTSYVVGGIVAVAAHIVVPAVLLFSSTCSAGAIGRSADFEVELSTESVPMSVDDETQDPILLQENQFDLTIVNDDQSGLSVSNVAAIPIEMSQPTVLTVRLHPDRSELVLRSLPSELLKVPIANC